MRTRKLKGGLTASYWQDGQIYRRDLYFTEDGVLESSWFRYSPFEQRILIGI